MKKKTIYVVIAIAVVAILAIGFQIFPKTLTFDFDANPIEAVITTYAEEVFEENLETALEEIASLAEKTIKINIKSAEKESQNNEVETEESLQKKLADAISEERYEDAAKLRDKLNDIGKTK